MRKSFEKEFGYAKVFDGHEKILDTTAERFGEEKRRLTESQFKADRAVADENGRRKLMRTVIY